MTAHEESFAEYQTDIQLLEIQGITLHANNKHIIGMYALFSTLTLLLSYFWSMAGIILTVLLWLSIVQDVRGKNGWIRSFLLKSCGRNIVSWFPQRLPTEAGKAPETASTVVCALPRNTYKRQNSLFYVLMAMATAVSIIPIIAPSAFLWAIMSFFLLTLICFALPPIQHIYEPNAHEKHNLLLQTWNAQERKHRISIVLYEDGFNAGGIPTFLQNYSDFLPKEQTLIVFLEYGESKSFFRPQGLFSKPSLPSYLQETLASTSGKLHAMSGARVYGWNSFLIASPMEAKDIEEICTTIDALSIES